MLSLDTRRGGAGFQISADSDDSESNTKVKEIRAVDETFTNGPPPCGEELEALEGRELMAASDVIAKRWTTAKLRGASDVSAKRWTIEKLQGASEVSTERWTTAK